MKYIFAKGFIAVDGISLTVCLAHLYFVPGCLSASV